MLDVGVGHQQHRLVDRAGFGVHSTGGRADHHYFFNDIHNHDNINHHDNGIDINDIKHSPRNNHKFIDKFNFFFFHNQFIYNNPSSRNDHNHRASSDINNHIHNNNNHDNFNDRSNHDHNN